MLAYDPDDATTGMKAQGGDTILPLWHSVVRRHSSVERVAPPPLRLRGLDAGQPLGYPPPKTEVSDVVFAAGFWMLWGVLLGSGLRKLRRIMRKANTE